MAQTYISHCFFLIYFMWKNIIIIFFFLLRKKCQFIFIFYPIQHIFCFPPTHHPLLWLAPCVRVRVRVIHNKKKGIIISTLRQSIHRLRYTLQQMDTYGIALFFQDVYDVIQLYIYWGWDSLGRLRFIFSSNTFLQQQQQQQPALINTNNAAGGGTNIGGGRSGNRFIRPKHSDKITSSSLPDLEDVSNFEEERRRRRGGEEKHEQHYNNTNERHLQHVNDNSSRPPPSHGQKKRHRQKVCCWDDEIEPAFLNDEDYPNDWLIFHPWYGVIPKKTADLWKMNEQQQQQQQQHMETREEKGDQ
mmetsp:Transcript_26168/g.34803  ORF Transcript_26168/g.34803 Transcript_26168/m.34803 type:complete len:302 (-) Transcript_26168:56-961(-)